MHRVGIFIYDGFELLDMSGPQTTFYEASGLLPGQQGYEQITLAISNDAVTTEAGTRLLPDYELAQCPPLDTLLIPGGSGSRQFTFSHSDVAKMRKLIDNTPRIVSICTGVFLLARHGFLHQESVCTHWNFVDQLARTFPTLKVNADSLFTQDKKLWTSAGVTAGIDLALHLVERDHDAVIAAQVARQLVVYLKRAGGQQQYSSTLQLQNHSHPVLDKLHQWVVQNLGRKMTIAALAESACIGERQLYRVVQQSLNMTPLQYVDDIRFSHAVHALTEGKLTVKQVAHQCGYQSSDGFRRRFEKRFGMTPLLYQAHFSSHAAC